MDIITDAMDLDKLWEIVRDSCERPGMLLSMWSQRVGHDLMTGQQQQFYELHPLFIYQLKDIWGYCDESRNEYQDF